MSDPLTALKHAVQVMNVLNMLIMKELKNRRDSNSQQSNLDPNCQMGSSEHQNASGDVTSRRTRNPEKQNSGTNTSVKKGPRDLSTGRGKVEEISDDKEEPLRDKEPRQTGKVNRIDSVVEHLEAFW